MLKKTILDPPPALDPLQNLMGSSLAHATPRQFHQNQTGGFCVTLLKDKQTDKQTELKT